MEKRLTEQELEDLIWGSCAYPYTKTMIWRNVGGNKNRLWKKVDEMVRRSDLKQIDEGEKEIFYVRIDSTKKEEFEYLLAFQARMLKLSRIDVTNLKKPLFKRKGDYKVTRWSSGLRESILVIDKAGEYKARTKQVTKSFENMEFYYGALILIIAKINLQISLKLIGKSEGENRIKKCQKTLEEHWNLLSKENPRDRKGIEQFLKHKIYRMENFRLF